MKVAILEIEIGVAVVADFDHAVFHTEGIGIILADIVLGNLRGPVVEVLSVEKLCPFGNLSLFRIRTRTA